MILYFKKKILVLCASICILFWVLDAILDSAYKTPHQALSQCLLIDWPIHEFLWRILVSILLILLGIAIHKYSGITDNGHERERRCDVDRHGSLLKGRKGHHVVISGTGRAGTTFLVQLMTALKLDTGFDNPASGIFPNCNAGMETDILQPDPPYIVKSPWLCDTLEQALKSKRIVIDHALIPIRDLYAAAESRRVVSEKAGFAEGTPGGLWHTKISGDQETVLTLELYNLFLTLTTHDIPVTLLHFPRFVKDPKYLYDKIRFLLPGIGYPEFQQCFQSVSRPELVHDFTRQ